MTHDEMREFLLAPDGGGYVHVAQLDDGGWVGIVPLLHTWGLCVELDMTGYSRRYCFESLDAALAGIAQMGSLDDVPAGWVAAR